MLGGLSSLWHEAMTPCFGRFGAGAASRLERQFLLLGACTN